MLLSLHRLERTEDLLIAETATLDHRETRSAWMIGDSPLAAVHTDDGWRLFVRLGLTFAEGRAWIQEAGLHSAVFRSRRDLVRTVTAAAAHLPLPVTPPPALRRLSRTRYCTHDERWTITKVGTRWRSSMTFGPAGEYSVSHVRLTLREAALTTLSL